MVKKIYGMKIKNEQERLESQSGGAFYCLARKVILEGGVVYGVVLNEKVVAEYARATTLDELIPMKGSKYVQVNMGNTLENVCEDLKKGKKVFFSGTPCCVAGLLSFLKQVKADTIHLITCDIVCHGVASPLIFRKFIQFVSKDNVREIKDFKFRDKSKGWHSHFETYYFRGKQYCTNNYARLFSSGNCLRESCYECQYANYNRVADITIGDFWGIEKYYPELDDNKGNSLLMINSDKGLPLFESVKKDIIFWQTDADKIAQPQLQHPFPKAISYDKFWHDYKKHQFGYMIFKYAKGGCKGILKSCVINITTKVGIYGHLHNIWMKIKK